MTQEEARKKARDKLGVFRSCWNCNGTHEHLKTADYVIICIGCDNIYWKGVKLTAQHVYLDTGQTATEQFQMKDLTPLQREWEARTKQMLSDTRFPTRTGPHCRWCKFRQSAGGPCPEKM